MTDLVKKHLERRPNDGVRSCDARGRGLLGSVSQDVAKVFVANGDVVIAIPGVGYAVASLELQQEGTWQTQRAQEPFKFLEDLPLLEQFEYCLMIWVFRRDIGNFNP